MYDTLLVPTDGSDAAEAAAESALVLARQFDASIHAIHVLERGDLPADVESEAAAELTDAAEATLSTVADLAADSGVALTTQVLETTAPIHDAIVSSYNDALVPIFHLIVPLILVGTVMLLFLREDALKETVD